MTPPRIVNATAVYQDGQWEITLTGLGQHTATRDRARVPEYAQSLAAAILGMPRHAIEIHLTYPANAQHP